VALALTVEGASKMSGSNEKQLSPQEHVQVNKLHENITKNLDEVAKIVGRALGENVDDATEFSVERPEPNAPSGASLQNRSGKRVIVIKSGTKDGDAKTPLARRRLCIMYVDPPGICMPCCW
jgi:hypothetical protein